MNTIYNLLILIMCLVAFIPVNNTSQTENEFLKKLQQKYTWLNQETYSIIKENSKKYFIPVYFVCAVIQIESGNYCSNDLSKMLTVRGKAGEYSLMQVMPYHFKDYENGMDLATNIKRGCQYFSRALKKGKGNIREAARLYNGGLSNKKEKYKNWKYVNRIEKSVNEFIQGV